MKIRTISKPKQKTFPHPVVNAPAHDRSNDLCICNNCHEKRLDKLNIYYSRFKKQEMHHDNS